MKNNNQKQVFLNSEGDEWFSRNIEERKSQLENDRLLRTIRFVELSPTKILEIGCSNGSRINLLKDELGAECYGIDPSTKAIEDGKKQFSEITLQVGTADSLPFEDNSFDTIIFGFCLYLCDRNDLFKIAFEADRCLIEGGTMIIKDFYPKFPYKNSYLHKEGIFSYKMNYSKMFTWNPYYAEVANIVYGNSSLKYTDIEDEKEAIVILRKVHKNSYPLDPFKEV